MYFKTKKLFILILTTTILFMKNSEANYEKNFFDFSIMSLDGTKIELSKYKNNAVLLVNVASNCGFTKQYGDLQKIWELYKDKGLVVIGAPSNQFGSQEPGTNDEIKKFCKVNFNVNFPMTDKINVKGNEAHDIYKWAVKNFGKSAEPKWNFHKILINKEGIIVDTYSSFTKPTSKKIIDEIENILNIK